MPEKKFQKVVVETLMDILDELKNINSTGEITAEIGELPIKTLETFDKMSREIEENRDIRQLMVAKLSQTGGKDVKTCTNKTIDRIFTNDIMEKFYMQGGGPHGKRAFKKTPFYSMITESVQNTFKDATEYTINSAMAGHLKQAPARSGGGGYKRPRTPLV